MYQIRIYTLRSPEAAEEYAEVCWKKHVESLEKFGIRTEHVFKQVKRRGWTRVIGICGYDEGADIEALKKAYMQSEEFREDMRGFSPLRMRFVRAITVAEVGFLRSGRTV